MSGRPAAKLQLDRLLASLLATLREADRAVLERSRRQNAVNQAVEQAQVGPPTAGVHTVDLRIPRYTRVRELSLEFDCEVKLGRGRDDVRLVLGAPSFWRRRPRHRISIELKTRPTLAGRVCIDGIELTRTPSSPPPSSAPP